MCTVEVGENSSVEFERGRYSLGKLSKEVHFLNGYINIIFQIKSNKDNQHSLFSMETKHLVISHFLVIRMSENRLTLLLMTWMKHQRLKITLTRSIHWVKSISL